MFDKIVIVTRSTRLEELIQRFNTKSQAKFYIEHAGGDFAEYEQEHDAYAEALSTVRRTCESLMKVQVVDRRLVSSFLFAKPDLVVTLGQDGLVANTAKYAAGQPIIAVNPDPERFDGILLPFLPAQTGRAIASVLQNHAKMRVVTMAEAVLNDTQRLLAFNDLFLGAQSHVSARYRLHAKGVWESQSSSGVLVSTGAGSTGWLSSVFQMARGVTESTGGHAGKPLLLNWEDERLFYVVREPFVSKHSTAGNIAGVLAKGEEILLESRMPSGGVIFSDGVEADHLNFNSGAIARVGVAKERALLVAA